MKYAVYSDRQVVKILKRNGYYVARKKGDHTMWKKDGVNGTLIIPASYNPMLINRVFKENKIIVKW